MFTRVLVAISIAYPYFFNTILFGGPSSRMLTIDRLYRTAEDIKITQENKSVNGITVSVTWR